MMSLLFVCAFLWIGVPFGIGGLAMVLAGDFGGLVGLAVFAGFVWALGRWSTATGPYSVYGPWRDRR